MPGDPYRPTPDVRERIEAIFDLMRRVPRRPVTLMEVCGTHTMSIARAGLRSVLPEGLRLVSGPGCPVCVTPAGYVDTAIDLAKRPEVVLATFGDMIRVPGNHGSLEEAKARGADVRVVYSPMRALELAAAQPERSVVFLGVGFETTAPATAALVRYAAAANAKNLFVLSAHKLIPPAMRALAASPDLAIDGFLLPGHVSVVLGLEPYRFLAEEFARPCVVAGFDALDVLESAAMLLKQMCDGRAEVENQYRRIVRPDGNASARAAIDEVFEPADTSWRGFGVIPQSGLAIRERFRAFDAEKVFGVTVPAEEPRTGCRCGDVLRGLIRPPECPLFADPCNPAHPIGPCMVSSEGACAASYRFEQTV
jgi:hydrogenase expression/formation protein HypD